MIKVGIYGPAAINSPERKQLLRLLLRHPDVDLRCVASPVGNTVPLAELHPVYAGETDLTLERELVLDGLDVLFVIDAENLTEEIAGCLGADPEFRLIVLGSAPALRADAIAGSEGAPVYGLPEYFRKALVRGARYAVSPAPAAILIELSLLPLVKAGILPGAVKATLATPDASDAYAAGASESVDILNAILPGAVTDFELELLPEPSTFERLDIHVEFEAPMAIEEIARLYRESYDDHSFVHIIGGAGAVDEDLRGSNKCLIRLNADGDRLMVDASMDALTKGETGNAVHIMNLLFGLLERTGLSI